MKFRYFLSFLLVALLFTSCGNKQRKLETPDDLLMPPSVTYNKQDTADIQYLVKRYVDSFGKGDLETCANMLYTYSNDSIKPYTDEQRSKFRNAFSHFNIYGSMVKDMILRSDVNNQVDIRIQIIKNGNMSKDQGVTTLSLNPVRVGGKWYLTLLDKDAEGVKDVYQTENQ